MKRPLGDAGAPPRLRASARPVPAADWLVEQYVVHRASAAQIAGQCGWSEQYVRDRLLEAGVTFRRSRGNASNGGVLDEATLAGLVGQGLSAAQMAERTGYSVSGVHQRLRRAGLAVRAGDLVQD